MEVFSIETPGVILKIDPDDRRSHSRSRSSANTVSQGIPRTTASVKGALCCMRSSRGSVPFSTAPIHRFSRSTCGSSFVRARTRFDLLILDHTYGIGFDVSPPDHLASVDVIGHVARFRQSGLLKDRAQAYATHISHEGYLEHDELDRYAASNGYRIAFDGLSLTIDG